MEKNQIFNNYKKKHSGNLSDVYQEFMAIFEVSCEEELIEYLKDVNIPTQQVCAKTLKRGRK